MAEFPNSALSPFALELADDAWLSLESRRNLYRAMTLMAEDCCAHGLTQAAADTLSFLLLQSDLCESAREWAEDMLTDLEGRVCPRVIYDAREFAAGMDLRTMVEYLLEILQGEPNLTLAQRPLTLA